MKELDFDKYYEVGEPEKRERAYAWATAIGLQDVDGLKPSKYLHEWYVQNLHMPLRVPPCAVRDEAKGDTR